MAQFYQIAAVLAAAAWSAWASEDMAVQTDKCDWTVEAQSQEYLLPWCRMVRMQARYPACYPLGVPGWKPQGNIIVQAPDPASCNNSESPEWTIAGWTWKYIQLAPNETYALRMRHNERRFIKLLRGSVLDLNQNGVLRDDGHWETFVVTTPVSERDLHIDSDVDQINAGENGAIFALMTISIDKLKAPITSMTEPRVLDIKGPHSDLLTWTNYGEYYPQFKGWYFWNLAGIKLNDHEGKHLNYNQWWTAREDMNADGGYHNQHDGGVHNSTFGELHMMMYPSNPNVGLIVQLPGTINTKNVPRPEGVEAKTKTAEMPMGKEYFWNQRGNPYVQLTVPLTTGYVHGPLWSVNKTDGTPTLDCHGAIRYPYHGLITGYINDKKGYHEKLRYSMWVAFEHPLKDITIPPSMLQYVTNAFLDYQVDWAYEGCGGPHAAWPEANRLAKGLQVKLQEEGNPSGMITPKGMVPYDDKGGVNMDPEAGWKPER